MTERTLGVLQQATQRGLAGRSKPYPGPDAQEDTVGWLVGPIKKWLPETCNSDFPLAQEMHLPKDALVADESSMRSHGWRRAFRLRSSGRSEWVSNKQTARSLGSAEVMVAAALRHGLATPHGGGGDRGIELCKGACVDFLFVASQQTSVIWFAHALFTVLQTCSRVCPDLYLSSPILTTLSTLHKCNIHILVKLSLSQW